MGLNVKYKTMKLLVDNIGENIYMKLSMAISFKISEQMHHERNK